MNKYVILTSCFLVGISFSTVGMAQDVPASNGDVAQLLYPVIKQQIVVKKAYKDLVSASEKYVDAPTPENLTSFQDAIKNDIKAVQDYKTLVARTNEVDIEKAEKKFYEETPATKAEIETGPKGESVQSEIPEPPPMIVERLKREIKETGGIHGQFADQLRAQKNQLKSVQDRINTELNSPAVQNNPNARKQDMDLRDALSKAIDARRKALGEN